MRGIVAATLVAFAATGAGCGSGEPYEAIEEELGAASFSNADELHVHGTKNAKRAWEGLSLFELEGWNEGGNCPRIAIEGEGDAMVITAEGGCTDAAGKTWSGRATRTGRYLSRTFVGSFEGLQVESTSTCEDGSTVAALDTLEGAASALDRGDGLVEFEIDVRHDRTVLDPGTCALPGVSTTIRRFAGTFRESGGDRARGLEPARVVWNGSGILGDSDDGVVEVETIDVVWERSSCDSEPLSGRTVLEAGGHRAVLRHDGAKDCDPAQTVTWTYDGKEMGEAEVASCAVRRPGAPAARPALAAGALLAMVALLRLGLRRRAL